MDERRAWRSLAVVTMLLGIAAAVTIASCGGGGGSSNGQLCEQCGDTDGPCDAAGADITPDQTQPIFCPNRNGTGQPTGPTDCHAELTFTRKVDSSQRRCFPSDPTDHALDLRYECDGSRPGGTPAPTGTPTPTDTPTPTNTGLTPTPTATTPTGPTATATPGGPEDVGVTIDVSTSDSSDLPLTFTGAVTYPTSKGKFATIDCDGDDGFTATDAGNGTLLLSFSSSDTTGTDTVELTCQFHQLADQTLGDTDLTPSVNPSTLEITAASDN